MTHYYNKAGYSHFIDSRMKRGEVNKDKENMAIKNSCRMTVKRKERRFKTIPLISTLKSNSEVKMAPVGFRLLIKPFAILECLTISR